MPKVKWGADLSSQDVDNAESGFVEYRGGMPVEKGQYSIFRFKLRWSKKGLSSTNNPKLASLLVLDGSWKPEHKKYDGCPFWDHMPVQKNTAFRVRQFCDALNVTSKDFMDKMVVDEDGVVQKIGKLVVADQDLLVYLKVTMKNDEEYGEQLDFGRKGGYLPFKEDDEDEADEEAAEADGDDDDDDDEDTPF